MRVAVLFTVLQYLAFFLALLLSGCSTYSHHQSSRPSPLDALQKARPHYAPVKEGQVEYYQLGQGSPLVLITGYAMDITSWNRQFLASLAKQHQVIVFNNRNVGKSYIHSSRYESQDLANDTYQLIQQLHLKKPAVLGISMGGMIAQQLAVLHPGQVGQLILINTAIAGKQTVHPNAATEKKIWELPTTKLGRYLAGLNLFFPPSWKGTMALALVRDRFQPESYTEIEPALIMREQRLLVTHWIKDNKTAKKISQLPLPVLILNGGADAVIPPVNSIILARSLPHAEFHRWEEGGHAMIYQYPDDLARAINHFIKNSAAS